MQTIPKKHLKCVHEFCMNKELIDIVFNSAKKAVYKQYFIDKMKLRF